MKRIEALKQLAFNKKDFEAFLILDEVNQLYFTGIPGTSCLLIPKKGENTLFVYSVNYEHAKAEGKSFKVELVQSGQTIMTKLASHFKTLKTGKIAIDTTHIEAYRMLSKGFRGKAKLSIENTLVQQLRRVKDPQEQELMRKAGEITIAGMKTACETIRPGVTEIAVAAELEYAMRKKGGWGTAFETIVASGIRSAYPHGGCTEKEICKGDLVVVDVGAVYRDYRSDMTRTFVAGKPTEKQVGIFNIVREAQKQACEAIKGEVSGKEVDEVARTAIKKAEYGEYFVHGLGHGVGLEVHEGPVLSPVSKDTLAVGNVVTVEPGIYVPGFGGIRVEDTVLVDKQKCERFTDGFYSLETRA